MRIDNNKDNSERKSNFKEIIKDKKYTWMFVAFPIMIIITVLQFILPHVIK